MNEIIYLENVTSPDLLYMWCFESKRLQDHGLRGKTERLNHGSVLFRLSHFIGYFLDIDFNISDLFTPPLESKDSEVPSVEEPTSHLIPAEPGFSLPGER